MLVVVSYDIKNNKRRQKLHKLLKDYGMPVQYSVFECLLDKTELDHLKKAAKGLIKRGEDSIIYYCLCENCRTRISAIRKGRQPIQGLTIVV